MFCHDFSSVRDLFSQTQNHIPLEFKRIKTFQTLRQGVQILASMSKVFPNRRYGGQQCHLAQELSALKDCKDFTMKLKVKYLFPTSSSGADFYIYQLPEGLGMSKVLAHGIRMQKNPQTREDIFWIFTDFHGVMWFQSPTCTLAWKFHQQCC